MSFFNNILKVFLGDKSKKDLKKFQPLVEKINLEYEKIQSLSNDDLREKTSLLKNKINESRQNEDKQIIKIKNEIKNENDFDKKDTLYKEIDLIEKEASVKVKECLNSILPESFAVMKETASRFFHNTKIIVKANEKDRALSQNCDYVYLENENAVWLNEWNAAGKKILWI